MFLRSMILGAAAAVLISAPALAQQPSVTLAELAPCYVSAQADPTQREQVKVAAGGFTPLSKVDIYVDETLETTADVTFNGTAIGTVPAPFVESGQRPFTLRVAEKGNPDHTITKSSTVTAFSVEQSPKQAKTDQRVKFLGRGFTQPNKYVFAHYVFAGKSKKTVQIAYPQTPCGTFNVRRKQFPFKQKPNIGSWTIQFDQEQMYDPLAATQVRMTIKVMRKPKSSRAHSR
jgi:hypothetical protein